MTVLSRETVEHVLCPPMTTHWDPAEQLQSENSQNCPVYSGGQVHMKPPLMLVHVPPLRQTTEEREVSDERVSE